MYLSTPTNLSTVSFLKLPLSLSLFIIHEQCSIHMSLQISSLLFLYALYPGLDTKRFVCVFFCTESAQLCKIMFNTETECIISLYQHNCFTYFILAYIQWLIVYHTSFLCVLSTYLLKVHARCWDACERAQNLQSNTFKAYFLANIEKCGFTFA